jgi:hypothetical protein
MIVDILDGAGGEIPWSVVEGAGVSSSAEARAQSNRGSAIQLLVKSEVQLKKGAFLS